MVLADCLHRAYYFLGGLMKHAYNYTAIINPTVNSYKRLVPGYEAPVYIAWAGTQPFTIDPRSCFTWYGSTRVGTCVQLTQRQTHILALAVLLAAGLDGVDYIRLEAPEPIETNIYVNDTRRT